jgi:hypothetical protein
MAKSFTFITSGLAVALIAFGVIWTQVVQPGSQKHIAWQDVTAQMPPLLWPKSVTRSFTREPQLQHYMDRSFPLLRLRAPRFDFSFRRRRLILIATGPRSSTGYGVKILRVTERRSTIDVLAKEITPTLGDHAQARLTSPFRLITIPYTHKRVYVEWQGRP